MARIANTFFELKNGNRQYDAMANLAGVYQDAGTPEICPSGFLVTKLQLMPASGYNGILNGNTWIFNKAVSGSNTTNGEILELFAYDSYDVNMVGDGVNNWRVGANTAGLELPADVVGTFCRIVPGWQYVFGSGNFSTAPTDLQTTKYATVSNGLLVAGSSAPDVDTGYWFEIVGEVYPTVGTRNWGKAYRVIAHFNGIAGTSAPVAPTADVTFALTTPSPDGSNTINGGGATKTVTVNVKNSTDSVVITATKTSGQTLAKGGTNQSNVTLGSDGSTTQTITVDTTNVATAGGSKNFTITVNEGSHTSISYAVTVTVAGAD